MADRYINCESVYQFAKELCKEKETGVYAKGYNNALHAIMSAARSEALPAADVRHVVRGRWKCEEDTYFGFTDVEHRCSQCGKAYSGKGFCTFHFCPNCGADMREAPNEP